ncbi:uncharacterized protein IAS62_004876 [Cryptococcus decagattii]|uniref:Uncharacterized protein n=1 Tax=Cryptococcus decagattii TaxID=1859122 RepID=A0ABZ2B244_9TREE
MYGYLGPVISFRINHIWIEITSIRLRTGSFRSFSPSHDLRARSKPSLDCSLIKLLSPLPSLVHHRFSSRHQSNLPCRDGQRPYRLDPARTEKESRTVPLIRWRLVICGAVALSTEISSDEEGYEAGIGWRGRSYQRNNKRPWILHNSLIILLNSAACYIR